MAIFAIGVRSALRWAAGGRAVITLRVGEKFRSPSFSARLRLTSVIAASSLFLGGCADAPSTLSPQGPAAAQIAVLSWIMFALGAAIWVLVVAFLLFGLFRRRQEKMKDRSPLGPEQARSANAGIVVGGIVMPVVVLIGLIVLTVGTLRVIANTTPSDEVVIEVIGHQWWWEVRYPNQDVITANEIHIPVGQPIEMKLSSVDVIHSFWVPELHGKLDLVPGQTNRFILQADQPGEYRGQCAEFCGLQHAKMAFLVVAEPPGDFITWLGQQARPAPEPVAPLALEGQQVFLESQCLACHTVRGTTASGQAGPDLTHIASRRTLAAGTLPNTRERLAEWLIDPQTLKPGSQMPPTDLDPQEFLALLAYLESLK